MANAYKYKPQYTQNTIGPNPEGPEDNWPECEEFYILMQVYRHVPATMPGRVLDAYNDVKEWLRKQRT